MTSFSSIPSYLLGTIFTASGIISFVPPSTEYQTFGFPLPTSTSIPIHHLSDTKPPSSARTPPPAPTISPYVYAKGMRDLTYGLTYFIFQLHGQVSAITTFTGIVCIAGFVDGLLVWRFGGGLRGKAKEHFAAVVVLGSWAGWRA